VTVRHALPKNLSARQRELLRELAGRVDSGVER
jgi:hypothetical protein